MILEGFLCRRTGDREQEARRDHLHAHARRRLVQIDKINITSDFRSESLLDLEAIDRVERCSGAEGQVDIALGVRFARDARTESTDRDEAGDRFVKEVGEFGVGPLRHGRRGTLPNHGEQLV